MGRAACEDQQTPDQPEYPTTSQSCLVDGQWHLLYKAPESVCLIYEAAMMVDVGLATEPTQTPLSDIPYSVRFSGQSAQSALSQSFMLIDWQETVRKSGTIVRSKSQRGIKGI
jgi:hypothetical protein